MPSIKNNVKLFYVYSAICGLFFIVPIWVAFERKFLSFSEMALLEALGTIILVILQLPTGALADLIGRKNTMILGWGVTGMGWIMTGFCSNLTQFIIAYSITNLGIAMYQGADTALVYDTLKEIGEVNLFQKIMSKKSVIFQTSIALGTVIGGYLYLIWNPLPYILTGLMDFVLILILIRMTEPQIDSEKFTPKSYFQKNVDGFKEIFKNAHVKYLSLFYVAVGGLTWTAQIFFNQTLATEIGMSIVEKSWFFSAIRIFNSLFVYKLVTLGIINKKRAFLFFPIVMLFAFLPGIFASKLSGMAMIWLATFMGTARFTILDKYNNDEFDSRHRATALSSLSMFVSIVYIILMAISTPLVALTSNKFMFSVLGVLTIIFVVPIGIKLWKEQSNNIS
jgi:MFS family permease